MTNAKLLNLKVRVPDIPLCETYRFKWRRAYNKAAPDRIAKSPAVAKNAPALPSVSPAYYVLPDEDARTLIDQLPEGITSLERPTVVYTVLEAKEPSQLCIHKDWGWSCSINAYVKTTGEITTFYDFNRDTHTVTPIEAFCANPEDVWVMCSKTPHGVVFPLPTTRVLVNFSFRKLTHNDILVLI